jgi:hypothetical protein
MDGFESKIDEILDNGHRPMLAEGMVLNVNTIVADAIKIPEGVYVVAAIADDNCVLVPTTAESENQKFEVFKQTLLGFFNPDIHKKIIDMSDGPTIIENKITEKTWMEIRKEHAVEHGENSHCLRLECVRCGNTETCRCSKPKITKIGICDRCRPEQLDQSA